MKTQKWYQCLWKCVSKQNIERATLWILTVGVLVAVSLNVAKFAVRDYREFIREVNQPTATQTHTIATFEQ
jgi:hypothetical protein